MVWSEFSFSDNYYDPTVGWYLDNIGPEAEQNVRRLNRHPSNVVW